MPPTPSTPKRVLDPSDPDFTPAELRIPELRSLLATRNIRLPTSARKPALVKAVEETFGTPASQKSTKSDKEEEDEEAGNFSDQNVFQARRGSESRSIPRANALVGRKSAGAEASPKKELKTKDANLPPRRKTIGHPESSSPAVRQPSSGMSTAPSSRTPSTIFQNYMDPIVAKATPPRKLTDSVNSAMTKTGNAMRRATGNMIGSGDEVDDGAEADISGFVDGYEDTDEEEVEEETPSKVRGKRRSLPSTKHRRAPPSKGTLSSGTISRWLAAAILVGWWLYYVQDSKVIGYCDSGSDSNALIDARNADYARRHQAREHGSESDDHDSVNFLDLVPTILKPTCTPCPAHAVCTSGVLQSCLSDEYIFRRSVVSRIPMLKSILPMQWLSDRCYTDNRRLEMIDELAGEIARQLGVWRGAVTCGGTPQPEVVSLLSTITKRKDVTLSAEERGDLRSAVREDDLFTALQNMRDEEAVPSEEYFSHLWESAIEELQTEGLAKRLVIAPSRGEAGPYLGGQDEGEDTITVLISAASLALIPLGCRLRLAARSLLRATILYIASAIFLVLGSLYVRYRLNRFRFESHKIDELATEVLQRLAEQQLGSLHSSSQPSHLPANHLRDTLLPIRRGLSAAARKSIWSGVSKRVESNSNVRVGMKKWKGEYSRCWDWVGVVTPGYGTGGLSARSTPGPGTPVEVATNGGSPEEGDGESGGMEEMRQSRGADRVVSYGAS